MPLLSLERVSKRFNGVPAVDDVSFAVDRGQVVGFLGPNGAGKSTTMRMITQYFEPDAGAIRLDGMPLAEAGREAKRRIGYLPENNPLYDEMLVSEYLDFVGRLRELRGPERAVGDGRGDRGYRHRAGVSTGRSASCPRGSASGWASRRPSFTGPICWCWTSRPRASTPTSGSRSGG